MNSYTFEAPTQRTIYYNSSVSPLFSMATLLKKEEEKEGRIVGFF